MRTQFVKDSGNVEDQITDLMECEPREMERQDREHPNRERIDCAISQARVIKTIRLRYWQMKSWIKQSDIKVKYCSLQVIYSIHSDGLSEMVHLEQNKVGNPLVANRFVYDDDEVTVRTTCSDMFQIMYN